MGDIKDDADSAWRDYVTPGDSGSGAHEPVKSDIRAVFALIDALVGDAGVRFSFDSSTTTADDPGAGDIRLNNATLASVTEVGISDNSAASGNPSVAAWLATFDDGTSSIKGHLFVRKVGAPQNYAIYAVTAATDATTHWRFTVTHVSSAGSFSAGDSLAALFVPKGDKGDVGASGSSGASGLTIVRAVATSNVDISTALENGDTLDGVSLVTGDLVLLTGQTAAAENGVYVVVASGAASRHASFDAYDELPGIFFSVMEGTTNGDTLWRCTSDRGGTIDVTDVVIEEVSGARDGADVLLETVDVSAVAQVDIDLPSGYAIHRIEGLIEVATDGANLIAQFTEDAFSTVETATYEWNEQRVSSGASAPVGSNSGSDSSIRIATNIGNAAAEFWSGEIAVFQASTATRFTGIATQHLRFNNVGLMNRGFGGGSLGTAGAMNGVRLSASSGNISVAKLRIWGKPDI